MFLSLHALDGSPIECLQTLDSHPSREITLKKFLLSHNADFLNNYPDFRKSKQVDLTNL